jgi:acyl-CoA thioesterase I
MTRRLSTHLLPLIGSLAISVAGPLSAAPTVLVVGDSLAAGYGLEKSEAFPALLEEMAKAAGHEVTVINAGVSGDTSAGGLRRIQWLLQRPIDVLMLELGANDGLRGIDPTATEKNLQGIIDAAKAKYPGIRIVITGMKMPPNLGQDYVAKFENIFPRLAQANGAALVPFLLEDVGGIANLNQGDRIHPTAEGQRILARNVWRVLEPMLSENERESAAR